MFKRFMRSNFVAATVGWLIAGYMTVVKFTTRWDIRHADRVADIVGRGTGVIALTWHSRFLMLTAAWKREWQMPHVLISQSRDGAIVAHTTHFLGLKTIRGSAKKAGSAKAKGGAKASRDVLGALETGGCIVVTPDGPRGPRQRLGAGPIRLAKLSGAPLMPCTFAVRHRKQFDSWDRFVLPLPFGRGIIAWGTPVSVPPDADETQIESIRLSIEAEMNAMLAAADTDLGRAVVGPA